ncbi:REP-associated tyrosine transposase [Povalibacter sp.]|uniref:REP-associated tyrosine transposase n=1 Tax=Povalibacter sp. TaxID=1962978 RepID=UPI002F3F2000
MARPLRIEFAGGFYHVTSRGNQRSTIFLQDADRMEWLALVAQVADRLQWRVYAYCQMDNHFHLLVQTPEPNLSRCMRHLNGLYTQRFNRHHHRCGHLLQGRYHAVIVDDRSYLLEVIRYVLLNPVRAGLVTHAADWQWSSFRSTLGETVAPPWLAVSDVLRYFAPDAARATRAFRSFVDAGMAMRSPWTALTQHIYLGDEAFIERTQALMLQARREDPEIPRSQRIKRPASLTDIFVDTTDVASGVVAAYCSGRFTMRQIAAYLGVHYSTVSRLLARLEMLDCKT